MSDIIARLRDTMTRPVVLSASVAEGYPYADVPEMGMAAVVVTHDDKEAAAMHARELAKAVWARRLEFDAGAMSADDAIRVVKQSTAGPILLLDVGDNIGGGSSGDSVVLLEAARRQGLSSLLTIILDPNAAAQCATRGVGQSLRLSIGGKSDPSIGPPLDADATVLALHDGRYEATEVVHAGIDRFDAGLCAAVRLDTGQTVILTTKAVMPITTAQITVIGQAPAQFGAIVAKGVHSPLAGYQQHVTEIVAVDTPGVTSANLRRLRYRHRRKPMFPFEPDATWPSRLR